MFGSIFSFNSVKFRFPFVCTNKNIKEHELMSRANIYTFDDWMNAVNADENGIIEETKEKIAKRLHVHMNAVSIKFWYAMWKCARICHVCQCYVHYWSELFHAFWTNNICTGRRWSRIQRLAVVSNMNSLNYLNKILDRSTDIPIVVIGSANM